MAKTQSRKTSSRSAMAPRRTKLASRASTKATTVAAVKKSSSAPAQLLKRAAAVPSLNEVLPLVAAQDQRKQAMLPGTVLTREWNRQLHRVMVVEGGFAFEGKTFDSLSGIAFAITGTNWNGPRFFGLRAGSGKGMRT